MKIKIPIIWAAISAFIYCIVGHSQGVLSKLINFFAPQKPNPMSSYPPYAEYDYGLIISAGIIFIVSVCVLIYRIIASLKNKKTQTP